MAAAAATLTEVPWTLECDGTGALITNGVAGTSTTPDKRFNGTLVNAGANTIWIAFSWTATAATAPALTDAQVEGTIKLPAGASIPLLRHIKTFFPKCNAVTSVLLWFPSQGLY